MMMMISAGAASPIVGPPIVQPPHAGTEKRTRPDPLTHPGGALSTVRWKGSEGSKQTKHTTRKLTPCWFQKCIFFWKFTYALFWKCFFIKFGPFSALLALPVMIREEYGQMAHQTLPNILLSNASLVTKSCIARFVDDDAFNLCALSRGGWGKLAGGVKWPPPPVRHLTKVNEIAVVSGHLSSLEVTRSKISKSCPL